MRVRWTPLEVVLAASIVALGAVLRWWHVDGPSLWWDEVIQIGTAQQRDVWEVIRRVQLGSPPGSGNAGAVPLDYLLLHAWQRLVPMPDPAHLERYFRTPAFVWSALTPLALHLWARRWFGPAAGLAAATCLALTTVHMAYAIEARFYSFFAFMTVVNLAAFSRVIATRRAAAWSVFGLVGAAYFLSGLFGLLVLGVEFAVLGLDVGRRWWRRRREPERWRPSEVAFLVGMVAAVTLVPAFYYSGTDLFAVATTKRAPIVVLAVVRDALWTYASGSRIVVALGALGLCVVAVRGMRGQLARPLAATLVVVLVATLPAIALIERWKLYYFHLRHALFLVPLVALVVGVGAAACTTWALGRRRALALVLAPLLVGATLYAPAAAWVRGPEWMLRRTKSRRDMDPLMQELVRRIERAPRDAKVLLIAPRYHGGGTTNAVVLRYLAWWGLTRRVVFRATPILDTTMRHLRNVCDRSCSGRAGAELEAKLGPILPAVQLAPDAHSLLGLGRGHGEWPGTVAGVIVLEYQNRPAFGKDLGFAGSRFTGLRRWYLPGDPPPLTRRRRVPGGVKKGGDAGSHARGAAGILGGRPAARPGGNRAAR